MAGSTEGSEDLSEFVAQLVQRGIAPAPEARRVAEELRGLAGSGTVSPPHVEQLIKQYRQRFMGPHAIATAMRIGEELCSWQRGEHPPPSAKPASARPPRSDSRRSPPAPSSAPPRSAPPAEAKGSTPAPRSWVPPPGSTPMRASSDKPSLFSAPPRPSTPPWADEPPPPSRPSSKPPASTESDPPPTVFDLEIEPPKPSAPPRQLDLGPELELPPLEPPGGAGAPAPGPSPLHGAGDLLELPIEEPASHGPAADTPAGPEAPAVSKAPLRKRDSLDEFALELGPAAFVPDEVAVESKSLRPASVGPRSAMPSAAPVGAGTTLAAAGPAAPGAARNLGRILAKLGAAALGAVVLVVVVARPSCLFHPSPRDVSGAFASEHLGISLTLPRPWAHSSGDDTEKETPGWEKRTSVLFRGESPMRYEELLLLVTFEKTSGEPATGEDARTVGASETLGAAARQRECRPDERGHRCRSVFHPSNVLYNAYEYYFSVGHKVVYVRALYELRGDEVEGEREADAIVESIRESSRF
jgi:hypothetical protein